MADNHMFFSPEEFEGEIPPVPGKVPDSREYTTAEKALRDLFVNEYLVDYDAQKAAMRCGFGGQFAIEYSKKFMAEPYVQQRISKLGTSADVDQEDLEAFNVRRVREQLTREAFYYGPGASHSARVSALAKLAEINNMLGAKGGRGGGPGGGGAIAGGVMQVPTISNVDEWEAEAARSQDELTRDASEDRK